MKQLLCILKGLVLSFLSIILPWSIPFLVGHGNEIIGTEKMGIWVFIALIVSFVAAGVSFGTGFWMLNRNSKAFSISFMIPSGLYLILILYGTHCFGLVDILFIY